MALFEVENTKQEINTTEITLDEFKLFNGDAIEVLKSIPDNSVDLIVTDPPYALDKALNHSAGNLQHKFKKMQREINDLNIANGYDIKKYGIEFLRVLKNPNIYLWCNKLQIPDYIDFYVKEVGCHFDILCWHKTNPLPTMSNKYLVDTEFCLFFRKNATCEPPTYQDAFTYWVQPINNTDKKIWEHPTIKPLNLIERPIKCSSKPGQIILDPFMGSGTTGVACKKLKRNFIGIEIDKKYFNISYKRINEF